MKMSIPSLEVLGGEARPIANCLLCGPMTAVLVLFVWFIARREAVGQDQGIRGEWP